MLFQKEKIEVIAEHKGALAAFPSEHLLLAVRGGRGRLSMDWFEPEKEAGGCEEGYRSILYLGDIPLLRIQANGSPTCESMLAAGYGIPEDCREIRLARAALDKPYAGLADALERVGRSLACFSREFMYCLIRITIQPMVTGISSGMYRSH